jgi:digeranylgeranylglycerophospholipid reductase
MADCDELYDAVVVGASFAGLTFAGTAAVHGARVLVLERDGVVGGVVRTTGVLFSDVFTLLDVPPRFLLNAVRRIIIHVPGQPEIVVSGETWRFFMADVTGMLQWLAANAQAHGTEIRCGATFMDAERAADGAMRVTYQEKATGAARVVRARFLIGADGAHSQVARRMGLAQNSAFLAGAEWLVADLPVAEDTFHLVMDQQLAPGYCLWLAPHGDLAALGVAGHQRAFKPQDSLRAAQAVLGEAVNPDALRVVERKGGVIPINGPLRDVYRDDTRGRVLLLGDAAGLCGPATGGGIYPALLCGRLAGQAVATEALNGTRCAVRAYLRDLPRAFRLGHYLRIESWLRRAMNAVGSNADLAAFYGVFVAAEGQAVLRRTLFETPIANMDNALFGIIRQCIGRSPVISRAFAGALWQRWRPRPQTAVAQSASAGARSASRSGSAAGTRAKRASTGR